MLPFLEGMTAYLSLLSSNRTVSNIRAIVDILPVNFLNAFIGFSLGWLSQYHRDLQHIELDHHWW